MYSDLINRGRELDAIATQGPWETGQYQSVSAPYYKICNAATDGDAAFIADSRTLIPQLCDALETESLKNVALVKANHVAHDDGFNDCKKADDCVIANQRREITELTARAENAEAELKSVHEALDFADKSREKCTNYAELAVSNGLALGRIAVAIQHDYGAEPTEGSPDGN